MAPRLLTPSTDSRWVILRRTVTSLYLVHRRSIARGSAGERESNKVPTEGREPAAAAQSTSVCVPPVIPSVRPNHSTASTAGVVSYRSYRKQSIGWSLMMFSWLRAIVFSLSRCCAVLVVRGIVFSSHVFYNRRAGSYRLNFDLPSPSMRLWQLVAQTSRTRVAISNDPLEISREDQQRSSNDRPTASRLLWKWIFFQDMCATARPEFSRDIYTRVHRIVAHE